MVTIYFGILKKVMWLLMKFIREGEGILYTLSGLVQIPEYSTLLPDQTLVDYFKNISKCSSVSYQAWSDQIWPASRFSLIIIMTLFTLVVCFFAQALNCPSISLHNNQRPQCNMCTHLRNSKGPYYPYSYWSCSKSECAPVAGRPPGDLNTLCMA